MFPAKSTLFGVGEIAHSPLMLGGQKQKMPRQAGKDNMIKTTFKHALATATLMSMASVASAETLTIGIGHQSTVTNTVPGGIIIEKLELLEKYLIKKTQLE